MTIYPYTDVDEAEVIRDSIELAALTVELRDLLDELDIPRSQRDRLEALIRDRDRETGLYIVNDNLLTTRGEIKQFDYEIFDTKENLQKYFNQAIRF